MCVSGQTGLHEAAGERRPDRLQTAPSQSWTVLSDETPRRLKRPRPVAPLSVLLLFPEAVLNVLLSVRVMDLNKPTPNQSGVLLFV